MVRSQQWSLTAFLLITVIKAVGQPITLPGPWDTAPITAHEVPGNVAFIREVIPRQQLAVCDKWKRGKFTEDSIKAAKAVTEQAVYQWLDEDETNGPRHWLFCNYPISTLSMVLGSTFSFLNSRFISSPFSHSILQTSSCYFLSRNTHAASVYTQVKGVFV